MMAISYPIAKGMILLWSGAVADIPAGWVLCNGENGTPDLRNKFVVAAGDTYNPDDSGGDTSHNHTFTSDFHQHYLPEPATGINGGTEYSDFTSNTKVTGTTDAGSSLPPYYALAYIMKL